MVSIRWTNVSHMKFMFPSDNMCKQIADELQWGFACKYFNAPTTFEELYITLPIDKWGRPVQYEISSLQSRGPNTDTKRTTQEIPQEALKPQMITNDVQSTRVKPKHE